MRVALFTIGCKVNQYETEAIAEKLEALGYERVDFREEVNVHVSKPCTATRKDAGFAERGTKPELV